MNTFRNIVFLILISFLLHFVWESLHIHLYTGYENLSIHIPITVWATLADVLYTLCAVATLSLFKQNKNWISSVTYKDYIGLAIIGLLISLLVEYKALLFHRWQYLDTMPIIPGLGVGLSPVLQMVLLLPLSVFLTRLFSKVTIHSS